MRTIILLAALLASSSAYADYTPQEEAIYQGESAWWHCMERVSMDFGSKLCFLPSVIVEGAFGSCDSWEGKLPAILRANLATQEAADKEFAEDLERIRVESIGVILANQSHCFK